MPVYSFIYVATVSLFSLGHKEIIETDDIANVLLVGERAVNYWTSPPFFALGRGEAILEKIISDTLQVVACQIPLIDLLDYFQ